MDEKEIQKQEELAKEQGEAAYRQINRIAKMVYEYEKVLNNDQMDSISLINLALSAIQAGFMLINDSFNVDDLSAEQRISSMKAILARVNSDVDFIYIAKDRVDKYVEFNKIRIAKESSSDFAKAVQQYTEGKKNG